MDTNDDEREEEKNLHQSQVVEHQVNPIFKK